MNLSQRSPKAFLLQVMTIMALVSLSSCGILSSSTPVVVVNDDAGGPTVQIEREANDGQALTIAGTIKGNDTSLNENVVITMRGLKDGTLVFSTERYLDELVDGEDLTGKKNVRFGLGVPSSDIGQYELEVAWGKDTIDSPAQLEIKTDAIKVHEVNPCPKEEATKKHKNTPKTNCKVTREVSIAGSIKNLRAWPVSKIELSVRWTKDKLTWIDHPSFSLPGKDGPPQSIGEGVIIAPKSTLPFEFELQVPEDWNPQDSLVVRVVKAQKVIAPNT
jgi:hypothetical protein